jgi:RNA recognition motif-containing protein
LHLVISRRTLKWFAVSERELFETLVELYPHNLAVTPTIARLFRPKKDLMKNIYVGNLDFKVTEDELRQAFSAYGQVENVTILKDRDTGQPRGFGFVEMANDEEADKAISGMNGAQIGSRALNVNEARPKEARAGGGFGGGRGGGGGGFGGGRGGGGGGRGGGFGGGRGGGGGGRNRY